MVTVKLKSIYPDAEENIEITVPDEVFQTIVEADREEMNYWRKVFRHKAHYSLDCGDGIEAAVLDKPMSPLDIIMRNQEASDHDRLLMALHDAVEALPKKQAERIYSRFFLEKKIDEIAKSENVVESAVRGSLKRGLENLKKDLKKML